MFMYKAGTSIKKRDFLFNIMCGKFRFDGDLSQSRRNFFSFLGRMVLFLSFFFGPNFFFIFFFHQGLSSAFDFPMGKSFYE